MDDVMSPERLDPRRAMEDAIASLDEQVKLRVTAVENGRKFQNTGHGEVGMPNGPSIFQTSGAWEVDFQLAEASQQRPPSVAVAVTADANRVLAIAAQRLHGASVARPRRGRF